MAFSDIEKNEQLEIVKIAIVNDDAWEKDLILKEAMTSLGDEKSDNQLFTIQYGTEEEVKTLLEDQKIAGYLMIKDEAPKIVIKESGIDATILQTAVDEIAATKIALEKTYLASSKPTVEGNAASEFSKELYLSILEKLQDDEVAIKDVSKANLSYTMIEFYTLIAMSCLYGGILAMVAVNQNLANMSSEGKRVSISPISKGKMLMSSILASYLTQLIGTSILLCFLYFLLHVDFGTNPLFVFLLTIVGSLAGLSLGVIIASVVRSSENTKTGILLSVTMLGCFLSGMMGITMKYIIDKNVPIINKWNPASMITDGFYSLYYYDTTSRYWFNIASLVVFAMILFFLSWCVLRRQKYDNI